MSKVNVLERVNGSEANGKKGTKAKRSKATKKELIDHLWEMHSKYRDLVWYETLNANSLQDASDSLVADIYVNATRIEAMYSMELDMVDSEMEERTHGFNCGMLAGIRYVMTAFDFGLEQAKEEFPDLDT